MRVNRRLLYVGLFLVAIGAVAVLSDASLVDVTVLSNVTQLWPLAVIAIGAALVLKRTRFSLAGGMFAAAMPGLVLGSAFAVGPRYAGTCGTATEPAYITTERGTFDGPTPPTIFVSTGCGALDVRTAVGHDWQLDAGNNLGKAPTIRTSAQSLAIEPTGKPGWPFVTGERDRWSLTLPQTDIDGLEIRANESQARIDLQGMRISGLELGSNAADVRVDATWATVNDLTVTVNAGSLSLWLPNGGNTAGSLRVNAGELQLCAPPELGISIGARANAARVSVAGEGIEGRAWQSDNYDTAAYHADLDIRANLGSVSINPIGGCR
jgi:hypothetical protein